MWHESFRVFIREYRLENCVEISLGYSHYERFLFQQKKTQVYDEHKIELTAFVSTALGIQVSNRRMYIMALIEEGSKYGLMNFIGLH